MARLIMVSNRLPVTVTRGPESTLVAPSAGGLASGLRGVHQWEENVWIGWPGLIEDVTDAEWPLIEARLRELRTVPVPLSARDVARFYEGYANGLLWPLFHYVTGVIP